MLCYHAAFLVLCSPIDTRSAARTISTHNRRGSWREAVAAFEAWEQHGGPLHGPRRATATCFVEVMKAHARLGAAEMVLSCFGRMRAAQDLNISAVAFTIAIRACATRVLYPVALTLLSDAADEGVPLDTVAYNAALTACSKAGQCQEAELLLAEMRERGPRPDSISFNLAISAASRAGEWRRALALLGEMEPAAAAATAAAARAGDGNLPATAGVPRDVFCFASAIAACERASQPEAALTTFRDMQAEGVAANTVAYNSAIRACATARLWPAALSLLDDMRLAQVHRSTISYNAALVACERGGAWEEAAVLLREMEEEGVPLDQITYHTAIACARRGGTARSAAFATDTLGQMLRAGIEPSVIGFTGAIRACNAARQWGAALEAFAALERAARRPAGAALDTVAVNEALAACAGAGRGAEAQRLLGLLRQQRPRALVATAASFELAARACRAGGEAERARRLEATARSLRASGPSGARGRAAKSKTELEL